MIDLRQLKYFVVVAEEEHVGRAAERLHISQSPLSRQIAQLEERLGLMLFERNQQRIRLTADGQTFLAETRSLLTHANRLESLGKRLGRGEDGGLCIGYIENAMHSGVLSTALRTLRTSRPDVHIALYSQPPATQIEGLRQLYGLLAGGHAAFGERTRSGYTGCLMTRCCWLCRRIIRWLRRKTCSRRSWPISSGSRLSITTMPIRAMILSPPACVRALIRIFVWKPESH